jgi:aarF domain-containing kinase
LHCALALYLLLRILNIIYCIISYFQVGQHCAALEYLLPVEFTQTLSVLHSRAPESNYSDIKRVIESDLNAKVEDIFVDFNPIPIGAASLAQVCEVSV